MYGYDETLLTVHVRVHANITHMTKDQALEYIKKHMGLYNDNDLAQITEVLFILPLKKNTPAI